MNKQNDPALEAMELLLEASHRRVAIYWEFIDGIPSWILAIFLRRKARKMINDINKLHSDGLEDRISEYLRQYKAEKYN